MEETDNKWWNWKEFIASVSRTFELWAPRWQKRSGLSRSWVTLPCFPNWYIVYFSYDFSHVAFFCYWLCTHTHTHTPIVYSHQNAKHSYLTRDPVRKRFETVWAVQRSTTQPRRVKMCLWQFCTDDGQAVVHTFNASTQEAQAGRSQWVQVQPGLHSKFQDSQGYTKKLF